MDTAERMMGKLTAHRGERVLGLLALAGLAVTAVLALWVTPPDADEGDVFRIIYIHVPSAWLAYLSFFIVFAASVAYLATKRIRWDRLAAASAEVGVLFIGLTLVLGSIWAKPTWGIWWTWDPRLTTTAVLFLIYVGYLAVRRLPDSPAKRARWSAAIGIVAFVDVPIVHLSVTWWRSQHQAPALLHVAPRMAASMAAGLLVGVAAFTLLYAYLVTFRLRVGRLEDRAIREALSPRLEPRSAPVEPPPTPPAPKEVSARG